MDQPQSVACTADWQALWREHADWLRTVLRARVRDDVVADELLQAVSVAAWVHRDQLCDLAKTGPWLYRIALRQVLMFWRTQGRQRRLIDSRRVARPSEFADYRGVDPMEWLSQKEIGQRVRDSLAELAAQDREILMLKHVEHWTYRQIAQYLGISNDKVIHRLGRARNRLRQRLSALTQDWD